MLVSKNRLPYSLSLTHNCLLFYSAMAKSYIATVRVRMYSVYWNIFSTNQLLDKNKYCLSGRAFDYNQNRSFVFYETELVAI